VQGWVSVTYNEVLEAEVRLMEASYMVRGEVVVVELKGRLNFETTGPFRKTCLERLAKEKVVFDLRLLNFVGSLGLKDFVDTLDHMSQASQAGIKFSGVSSEFRRLFEASGLSALNFYESTDKAVQSFAAPPALPQASIL
jgi:anti-anti-sigma factor